MTDTIDIANEQAEARLQAILSNRPEPATGPSAEECEDCDAPIPQGRRTAIPGVQKCIACQTMADQQDNFKTGRFLRATH